MASHEIMYVPRTALHFSLTIVETKRQFASEVEVIQVFDELRQDDTRKLGSDNVVTNYGDYMCFTFNESFLCDHRSALVSITNEIYIVDWVFRVIPIILILKVNTKLLGLTDWCLQSSQARTIKRYLHRNIANSLQICEFLEPYFPCPYLG